MRNGAAPTGIATVRLGVSILRPGRRILDLWQRDTGKHTDIRLELVSMPDDSEAINDIITHLGEDVDLISTAFDTRLLERHLQHPRPRFRATMRGRAHAITHWRDMHYSH